MDTYKYKTFTRAANNWEQFAHARKVTHDTGLTYEQAVERCKQYNDNRNTRQKRRGLKMEFTKE